MQAKIRLLKSIKPSSRIFESHIFVMKFNYLSYVEVLARAQWLAGAATHGIQSAIQPEAQMQFGHTA